MPRCPFAAWRPGPPGKTGYVLPSGPVTQHEHRGVVLHSAEGYRAGMYSRLNDVYGPSWHFSNFADGTLEQHYDTDEITWHAGSTQYKPPLTWSGEANVRFWGVESEGVAGERLTFPQKENIITLVGWLWSTHGLSSYVRKETLWEHKELAPTACPSDRIPWHDFLGRWQKGWKMATQDWVDQYISLVKLELEFRLDITGSALRGDYIEMLRLLVEGKHWPPQISVPPELAPGGLLT